MTRTHEGHGTYIYHSTHSETLFVPLDNHDFFALLSSGSPDKQALVATILKDYECSEDEALSAVNNTVDSLQKRALIES